MIILDSHMLLLRFYIYNVQYECSQNGHILKPFGECLTPSKSKMINEPRHEISNNVVHVCATSKASDELTHMRSQFRAFARHLTIL